MTKQVGFPFRSALRGIHTARQGPEHGIIQIVGLRISPQHLVLAQRDDGCDLSGIRAGGDKGALFR
jgi:hypothetical protein